jgi:hypothetical protein
MQLGDERFPTLEWNTVNAVLWNRVRLAKVDPDPTSRRQHRVDAAIEPYLLNIWISGKFILSVSWTESDRLNIRYMKRGVWESEVFALPLPQQLTGLTLH